MFSLFFHFLSTHYGLVSLGSTLLPSGYSRKYCILQCILPEIAESEDQDKVSAKGFAMGYIGVPCYSIFSLTMILFPDWYGGISSGMATNAFCWLVYGGLGLPNIPFIISLTTFTIASLKVNLSGMVI